MLRGCSQWGIPAERIYLHKLSFVSYACGYIVYIVLLLCNPRYSGEYKLNYISLFNFPILGIFFGEKMPKNFQNKVGGRSVGLGFPNLGPKQPKT